VSDEAVATFQIPQPATYGDFVRSIIPGPIDDRVCNWILWERTPFPLLMNPEHLRPYIERLTNPGPRPIRYCEHGTRLDREEPCEECCS
jgi:hypothetical protein